MTLDQKLLVWDVVGEWLCGVATLLAVFVSFMLARGSELSKRRSEKRSNAADLYVSFTSAEMISARAEAVKFLVSNNAVESPLSLQQLYQKNETNVLWPVNRLIQFWERTWLFIESDYVDNDLAMKLLRNYFDGHYQHYLAGLIHAGRAHGDDPVYLQWSYSIEKLAKHWNVSGTRAPVSEP